MKKIFITSIILSLVSFFGIILTLFLPVSKPVNISQKIFEDIALSEDVQSLNINSEEKVVEITLTEDALKKEKYKKLICEENITSPHFIMNITSVQDFSNYYYELTKNIAHTWLDKEYQSTLKVDQDTLHQRKIEKLGFIFLILVIWGGGLIYFIPTFVAYNRKHLQLTAIFLLNLLLGWTIFLWVAALIWSVIKKEK